MAALGETTYGLAGLAGPRPAEATALEIALSIEAVEAEWRALEARAPVTPYQRFDLTQAWVERAAPGAGIVPRIGVVRGAEGRVVMILPFGVTRRRGVTVATYLGGAHFNLNMPLVDPSFEPDGDRLVAILDDYCARTGVDLLSLAFQPRAWRDPRSRREVAHPLLQLRHHPATDEVRTIRMPDGFEAFADEQLSKSTRSKLRRKEQKFQGAGSRVGMRAETASEVERCVAAFVAQKSVRLAAQGIGDPFSEPGVAAFLAQAATAGLDGRGGLEFHAIEVDGAIVSVRAGVTHHGHHSLMIQSFDTGHPLAKFSPSQVLVSKVMTCASARGVTGFDFGVGDSAQKQTWSNDLVELFDISYAATAKGWLAARLASGRTRVVRFVKHSDTLFRAFKAVRAWTGRHRGASAA